MNKIGFLNTNNVSFRSKEKHSSAVQNESAENRTQSTSIAGSDYANMQKAIIKIGQVQTQAQKTSVDDMKPSEFRRILSKRDDIPDDCKEVMKSPYDLALYDMEVELFKKQGMDDDYKDYMKWRILEADAKAKLEVMPRLLSLGYDPKTVVDLHIRDFNKNQVEYALSRQDLIEKMIDKEIDEEIERKKEFLQGSKHRPSDEKIEAEIESARADLESRRDDYSERKISEILRFIDDDNVRYLDECIETTGSCELLPYWDDNSAEIYTKYLSGLKDIRFAARAMDRIKRRQHTPKSVANIAQGSKLTEVTERLLEFKDFDKFKDIDTSNFNTLSTEDKKEFLNAFISSVDPKDIIYERSLKKNYTELTQRMKIFAEMFSDNPEDSVAKYNEILRDLIHQIPEGELKPIQDKIEYGKYMQAYRAKHPHPAMTDDISKLPSTIETINGKEYKVITLDEDSPISIATHRFPIGESILNIEALECTDPNMLLCVGLKGGESKLNFDKRGYALVVKPRLGNDWWIQSYGDIDSGNGAEKNIFNIDNYCLKIISSNRTVSYIPELIKQELDLSANEYANRMSKVKDCTTLDEIRDIDPELENGIRNVIINNDCYEGILRTETMGVCVSDEVPLEDICPDVLEYCEKRDVPIIRIHQEPKKAKKSPAITVGVN